MKSYINKYYIVFLTGLLTIGTSSCSDWLTVYPTDRVVEENFWEDKHDLEGVRYGAYKQMASTVNKLLLWGDLRSDNYEPNGSIQSDIATHNIYEDIISGMPDSSMEIFDWGGVYTTINYCNKVLQHGEEVLERDKQFTTGEWIQMHAEMTALRALNYFYLIRAFKDVPYTTKVINTDSEVEHFPLTSQLQVLDSIILDCEKVKGKARNRFSKKADSKGLITNCAIYAMLADMYLWRASLHDGRHVRAQKDSIIINGKKVFYSIADDYNRAAECADTSLLYLARQNAEEKLDADVSYGEERTINYGLGVQGGIVKGEVIMDNCDMIRNKSFEDAASTEPKMEAQTSIFGDGDNRGNSRESIFELQFSQSDGSSNGIVNSLFGFGTNIHLRVNEQALAKLYEKGGLTGEEPESGLWDSRTWICCQRNPVTSSTDTGTGQDGYYCLKYHLAPNNFLKMTGSSDGRKLESVTYKSTSYNNWIIYRMTDVMLIKAEALACVEGLNSDKNEEKVKAICDAIHRRSYCNYSKAGSNAIASEDLKHSDRERKNVPGDVYAEKKETEAGITFTRSIMYVMNERQIELFAEGKRWFDLVRLAERHTNKTDSPDERDCPIDEEATKNDPKGEIHYIGSGQSGYVGNGQSGMSAMVGAFLSSGSNASMAKTLINRFKNRWGLYCPIYYMEVKASDGAILQNPVWNKSKYDQ